jgi:hypothetical protein
LIGGAAKSLKMFDIRLFDSEAKKSVAWKKDLAHKEAITDIKWNPFVPHWVATCG